MGVYKKIFVKATLFILPLIIFLGYLEINLRSQHYTCSYATKKYCIEKQLDSIETLVLGSSQIFNGIDVGCFSTKSFNLANVSQTIYYDKQLTLHYLPKLTHLKTVIIGISYFSFFYEMCDIDERWREKFYNTFYNIKGCHNESKDLFYLKTFQPKQAFTLALNHFKDEAALTIFDNGYQPKFKQKEISDSSGFCRVNIHNKENITYRRKAIEKNLEDLVYKLKEKNIHIIFLTTPVYNTYAKFSNQNVIDLNTSFIHTLCKKYNCKYLNYFNDTRFVKDDFEDNDHLKDNGAKKLSRIINDTLFVIK